MTVEIQPPWPAELVYIMAPDFLERRFFFRPTSHYIEEGHTNLTTPPNWQPVVVNKR